MTTLSPTEIYNVALQAGFTPDQAVTWTAIALAESRGNPTAHNPSGEDSRGLWQVNVASDVRDNPWGDLYDPLTNARAAYEISKHGTDMRPWTTTHASNQGTPADYRTYMDEARAAAGGAYLGDFSGVSGYRDPNPMGVAEPTGPVPGAAPLAPAEPDADRDGASDAFEMSTGTDPHVADTDRDGLTDGFELARGANPLALDTDADGLSDAYEVEIRTDLLAADTDADGLGDAAEVAAGRDAAHGVPVGPDGQPLAQGPAVDTDQDGLSDAFEGALGTDVARADTDGDGLSDALEQAGGTDPLHVDTDGDGIVDDVDIDPLGGPGGIAGIAGVPAVAAVLPPMPAGAPLPPPPAVPGPAAGGDDHAVRAFLDAALAQTGDPYVWASEADVGDADPTEFDCSELAQWAAGQVGVELPDGSWLQYLELKEQGAVVPVEQAVHTPGALLFSFDREPTPGGGRPGSAHVAISLGDGTTIEARGTRYGVGSWETGDRFQYAAIIPGVDGTGGVPPAAPVAAVVASVPPPVDTDQDGVADPYEMSAGTNPLLADSDADGLTDGFESGHGTNALGLDSDTDGLSDVFEVQSGINALSADSDGDGMTDAYELASLGHAADGDPVGLDPLAAVPSPGAAPGGTLDADGDGLSDAWESSLGTNPLHADSDRDGITDALETATGTDPLGPADDPEDRPDHPEP
jgi:hypothetical protein